MQHLLFYEAFNFYSIYIITYESHSEDVSVMFFLYSH